MEDFLTLSKPEIEAKLLQKSVQKIIDQHAKGMVDLPDSFESEEDRIDFVETKYLNQLHSMSSARYLGKQTYNKFNLDKVFGVAYDDLELPDFTE